MAFSAFFSGTEIAFISSNRVRASVDSQKKTFTARIVNLFYHHQEMFISTLLVGNNIMLVFYGMGMAVLLEDPIKMFVSGNEALVLLVQALLSTGIILITVSSCPNQCHASTRTGRCGIRPSRCISSTSCSILFPGSLRLSPKCSCASSEPKVPRPALRF